MRQCYLRAGRQFGARRQRCVRLVFRVALHQPPRPPPAGATVAGRDSHPPGTCTFQRRAEKCGGRCPRPRSGATPDMGPNRRNASCVPDRVSGPRFPPCSHRESVPTGTRRSSSRRSRRTSFARACPGTRRLHPRRTRSSGAEDPRRRGAGRRLPRDRAARARAIPLRKPLLPDRAPRTPPQHRP